MKKEDVPFMYQVIARWLGSNALVELSGKIYEGSDGEATAKRVAANLNELSRDNRFPFIYSVRQLQLMAMQKEEILEWLITMPEGAVIGINDDGMCLCLVDDETVYLEIGMVPEASNSEDTEDEDMTEFLFTHGWTVQYVPGVGDVWHDVRCGSGRFSKEVAYTIEVSRQGIE